MWEKMEENSWEQMRTLESCSESAADEADFSRVGASVGGAVLVAR